jgi:V/A-type H+-transporting ATPase subunit C
MDKYFDYSTAGKYAYSMAKIRFYETRLLSREKVLRMMGTDEMSECFRMLEEAGYPVSLGSHSDFNPILNKEYEKVLDVVKLLSMDERVYSLFAVRHDFHNLKTAVKEYFSKDDFKEAYQPGGLFEVKDIKSSVLEEDFKKLGDACEVFTNIFTEIQKAYEKEPAPKLIDIIADRLIYAELLKRARKISNNFLTRLFVKEIDLTNIRTFFRLRYLQKRRIDFVEAYIDGGDFHLDFFLKNYEDDFYTLKTIFKGTEFLGLITDGSTYIEENKSFLRLERLVNEYFMKYVKAAKWISFGLEPIIAYYYAKMKELKTVRIVLLGKQNELSYDEIKEGVSDEYI